MAYWAEWMFWAAGASAILTGFGVLLIAGTLVYTKRAALAAAAAVEQAKLSTEAAQEAVEITRTTAKRQLMAYVYVKDGRFRLADDQIECVIGLKNFGQTPAYDFEVFAGCKIFDSNTPTFNMTELNPEKSSRTILGPTAETEIIRSAKIGFTSDPQAIVDGKKAVFCWGKVTYMDAFKKPRYFEFKVMNRPGMPKGGVWAIQPHPTGEQDDQTSE